MLRALRKAGILGLNRRNREYLLRCNERRFFPLVDDKLATKRLCQAKGIPIPDILAVARHHFEVDALIGSLSDHEAFALKPARGAMGNGVTVVNGRDGDHWLSAGGRILDRGELAYHAAGIVSGLYALGGHADTALAEERLRVHSELREMSDEGVSDLRVVIYRGVPTMAVR